MNIMARKISKTIEMLKHILKDFYQNFIIAGVLCPYKIRPLLYRISGHKIGKKCHISPRVFTGPGGKGKLQIGNNVSINYGCFFDLLGDIIIENNCNLAMNVHCITGTHEIGDSSRRAGKSIVKPIIIGEGSWIGADTYIMPGVKIGKGCIIGAGALVNKDCKANCIYFGRPAKLYKKLDEDDIAVEENRKS